MGEDVDGNMEAHCVANATVCLHHPGEAVARVNPEESPYKNPWQDQDRIRANSRESSRHFSRRNPEWDLDWPAGDLPQASSTGVPPDPLLRPARRARSRVSPGL